jgi:tRNA(Arg) A34 adenosine deaminase TadA
MEPELLMRLAIDKAREGIQRGQSPFGCAIAREGKLLSCGHNTVRATPDATAHAEVNALRAACLAVGDVHLRGAIVATTCEPCPMCMAALHWAQVAHVYYGATIADAEQAGFNELRLPARELLRLGGSSVQLSDGLLQEECRQLFELWLARPDHCSY